MQRLITEANPLSKSTRYSYDTASNQTSRTDANGSTTNFTYDPRNLLTKRAYPDGTNEAFSYDQLGRQLTAINRNGAITTAYDALSRPTAVTDANGRRLSYSYDTDNKLTSLVSFYRVGLH